MGGKHSEYKEVKTADYLNGDVYGSGAHGQETMMAMVDKEDQSGKVHPIIGGAWEEWGGARIGRLGRRLNDRRVHVSDHRQTRQKGLHVSGILRARE